MSRVAIWAQLEAKPGKEKEVEAFLKSAQPLAEHEAGTLSWYAIKMGPGKYGHLRYVCRRKWTQRPPQRRDCQGALRQSQGSFFQTAGCCQAGNSCGEIYARLTSFVPHFNTCQHSDRLLKQHNPQTFRTLSECYARIVFLLPGQRRCCRRRKRPWLHSRRITAPLISAHCFSACLPT